MARNWGLFQHLQLAPGPFTALHSGLELASTLDVAGNPARAVEAALGVESLTLALFESDGMVALASHLGPFVAGLQTDCRRNIKLLEGMLPEDDASWRTSALELSEAAGPLKRGPASALCPVFGMDVGDPGPEGLPPPPTSSTLQPGASGPRVGALGDTYCEGLALPEAGDRLLELERLAYVDSLTGLANRRLLVTKIQARLAELQRYGWGFGVLFIDVDGLKQINDAWGHSAGDAVLRTVGGALAANLRVCDGIGRWGGDEFIVMLGNVENHQLAVAADKLRTLVATSASMVDEHRITTTVSIGATLACPEDTVEGLVDRADRLMYRGKELGRNQVVIGTDGALGRPPEPAADPQPLF